MKISRTLRGGAVALAAAAVVVGASQARSGDHRGNTSHVPKTIVLPGDTLFPEGMGLDAKRGQYFVGAIGGGAVLTGKVDEATATVFSPAGADGRTAALGARPDHRRVFVGSFGSGKIWIYDERSAKLIAVLDTGLPSSVLNDFSFLRDGTAFVTDSINPFLWRITFSHDGTPTLDKFLDFTGTAFVYGPGINADGIVTSPDGRFLVINQLSTGDLFRVDVATKAVTKIDVGGFDLTNADGMALDGSSLYVVRNANAQIVKVDMAPDFASGTVDTVTTSPAFLFPSAAVVVHTHDGHGDDGEGGDENDENGAGKLLVLNSQLDKFLGGGTPQLPFTITSITQP